MRKKHTKSLLLQNLTSLLLVLFVGSLGSLFIDRISAGDPFMDVASASTSSQISAGRVSQSEFRLNPSNPTEARSFEFSLVDLDGSQPDAVYVTFEGAGDTTYTCRPSADASRWSCPTPGLTISNAGRFYVFSG